MDLIDEYFTSRAYHLQSNLKRTSRRKNIAELQKKFKVKTTGSIPLISPKKLIHLKNKIKKSASTFTGAAGYNDYDSEFNDEHGISSIELHSYLSFKDTNVETNRAQKKKNSNPLEKLKKIDDKIRQSFSKSYQMNFPDSENVLEDVLHLMFGTADKSFTEAIKVNTKPVCIVPDVTAKFMNVKNSLYDRIDELVRKDLKTAGKLKTEKNENDFKSKWYAFSQHHPCHKDLETFSAVWKDITHLQTTRQFCAWLVNNSNITPPIYLKSECLLKHNTCVDFEFSMQSDSMVYENADAIIESRFRKSLQMDLEFTKSSSYSSTLVSIDI